jgi:hypothetical protein
MFCMNNAPTDWHNESQLGVIFGPAQQASQNSNAALWQGATLGWIF